MKNLRVGDKVGLINLKDAMAFNPSHSEILPDMEKYFGRGVVTIRYIDVITDFFMIYEDDCNYWFSPEWVVVTEKKEVVEATITQYTFRDTDVNIEQLCSDATVDGLNSFIVIGGDKAIVGVLKQFKWKVSIDVEDKAMDVATNQGCNHAYELGEIELWDISFWIGKLKKYSKDCYAYKSILNKQIKDRSRKKGDKKFKVMGF